MGKGSDDFLANFFSFLLSYTARAASTLFFTFEPTLCRI
jgi:hypothetical protein